MPTTCSSNTECPQGACCEAQTTSPAFMTCSTLPTSCFSDSTRNGFHESCQANSQCVTQCCHDTYNYCIATRTTSLCSKPTEPGVSLWVIILAFMAMIGVIVILAIFCCYYCRKKKGYSSSSLPRTRRSASVRPISVSSGGSILDLRERYNPHEEADMRVYPQTTNNRSKQVRIKGRRSNRV